MFFKRVKKFRFDLDRDQLQALYDAVMYAFLYFDKYGFPSERGRSRIMGELASSVFYCLMEIDKANFKS